MFQLLLSFLAHFCHIHIINKLFIGNMMRNMYGVGPSKVS